MLGSLKVHPHSPHPPLRLWRLMIIMQNWNFQKGGLGRVETKKPSIVGGMHIFCTLLCTEHPLYIIMTNIIIVESGRFQKYLLEQNPSTLTS